MIKNLLYKECLEEEPIYIPRKFQNNKVYTMNDQENNIYNKLALEKLKTGMEIPTIRREHFRISKDTTDKEIEQFLDNKSISEILRREVLSEWEKECQKDVTRLQDICKKKIEGTKKAFQKDKAFIHQKSNSNKTKTNGEDNVSNMKGNNNDTNEERRDTPNPRRQNSYNYNQ